MNGPNPFSILPARTTMNTEADRFLAALEVAVAHTPDQEIVRVPGSPPVTESAREKFIDAVSILFRAPGEGAAHFTAVGDKSKPIFVSRDDLEWVQNQLFAWMGQVREHADAKRSGQTYIPEIPNPYRFLLSALVARAREDAPAAAAGLGGWDAM
jgi:hypothetical protein